MTDYKEKSISIGSHPIRRWQEIFSIAQEIKGSGDELIIFFKKEVDAVIIADEKINEFMDWVNEKSVSIVSSYTQTAIRTFYFALASAVDNYSNCSFNKGCIREIKNNIFSDNKKKIIL